MDLNLEQKKPPRDIEAANTEAWTVREFPAIDAPRANTIPVVIKQSILNEIHRHGQSYPDVEVCGVVVGNGYRDDSGPFVYLEAAIRGEHASNHQAQVTFTSETWNHIFEVVDRDWPDRRILGWYHTHPGFGIFLSAMDLYIQESFFGMPEQVALVYDPHSGDEGLFVWRDGEATRSEFVVEPDATKAPPRTPRTAARHTTTSAPASAGANRPAVPYERVAHEVERLRRQQDRLLVAVVSIGAVAVIFPLVVVLLLLRGSVGSVAPSDNPRKLRTPSPPVRPSKPTWGWESFDARGDRPANRGKPPLSLTPFPNPVLEDVPNDPPPTAPSNGPTEPPMETVDPPADQPPDPAAAAAQPNPASEAPSNPPEEMPLIPVSEEAKPNRSPISPVPGGDRGSKPQAAKAEGDSRVGP